MSLDKIKFFYELATVPLIKKRTFEFGGFVSFTNPPLIDCSFKNVMFLTPILEQDQDLSHEIGLLKPTQPFELLTVNLISDSEFQFASANDDQFNEFLDMLDENEYPRRFDPNRKIFC